MNEPRRAALVDRPVLVATDDARTLTDQPGGPRRLFQHARVGLSGAALLLTTLLLIVFAARLGQPLRAAAVLMFLGAGPALLVGRFARVLGPAGAATVGAASAGAAAALVAGAMLAARAWAPELGLLALSALVGLIALLDLLWALKCRLPT